MPDNIVLIEIEVWQKRFYQYFRTCWVRITYLIINVKASIYQVSYIHSIWSINNKLASFRKKILYLRLVENNLKKVWDIVSISDKCKTYLNKFLTPFDSFYSIRFNLTPFYYFWVILWLLGFLDGRSKKILKIPRDRTNIRDFKTYLHFAETSSRPIKATLKVAKITTITLQNLPEKRVIE